MARVRLAVIMPRGEDGHYGVEPIVAEEAGGRVHALTLPGALGIVEPATALELARRLNDWALHVEKP